ncbi:ABC transporter permease [Thermanaerothrix sp.]|uniref:ABC transporter permease n=1 Tax=Thermanaerothrix sp. TaxID=2972675 RepID=UPI003C7BB93C
MRTTYKKIFERIQPKALIELLGWNGYQVLLLLMAIFIFVLMSLLEPHTFPTINNLTSMAFQISELGILSIGMALSFLIGGVDLSITATANLSAVLAGLVLKNLLPLGASDAQVWLTFFLAALVALAAGLLCGAINGLLIGRVGVPPILATLSTLTLYTGIAVGITGGTPVSRFPEQILFIGIGKFLGIPIPLLIFIFVFLAISILLNRTAFGFKIYMLGTNPIAAQFSGINNKGIILWTHTIIGLLSAITGIIILTRTNSAYADYGTSYILMTILVTVLGGVAVSGGFGKLSGVVLGLIALQFLSTGFNMVLLKFTGSNFFRDFAWGLLLLLVMVINYYSNVQKLKSKGR